MASDLTEALNSLRAVASLPDTMLWGEVAIKVPQARALVAHIDQLATDRDQARTKLATLTAAAELHRPLGRDKAGQLIRDPAAATDWWCQQCARRVKATGCATWKAAGL